jgi:hypothetical protein
MSADASLQMVQIVLHWAWDPIGVRGIEMAADEYNMYAPHVLEMLNANAPDEQIADYLTGVVRDGMGLPTKPDKDEDVAAMLRELYAITRR